MKRDAFDDLPGTFNYTEELQKARETLNLKVASYISENPTTTYRELARAFRISAATMFAIASRYCRNRKRKPGRRPSTNQLVFEVRSDVGGKKLTRVIVAAEGAQNVSVASTRSLVVALFKTDDVSIGRSDAKPDREASFTLPELEEYVKRASLTKEKARGAVP